MDPNKETFRKKWLQFQNTLVRRGHFRNRDPANPVFDQGAEGGAALYVPSSFKFKQILEVCWHLLGPSHRHTWENYVTRLKHGECERFFDGFSLHDRDWSELENCYWYIAKNEDQTTSARTIGVISLPGIRFGSCTISIESLIHWTSIWKR